MKKKPLDKETLFKAKQLGYSDKQLAKLFGTTETGIRELRGKLGVKPVFKTVDTCAAEFEAETPYHFSTYQDENESVRSEKKKVMILGSGPNRIGQGIEFDYCCVHGSSRGARRRLRSYNDQLQSGNGFHRLRHCRQTLFRAADI